MRSLLAFLALLQVPRAQASESSPFCSVLPSGEVSIPGSDTKFTSTCTETPASFSYEIDLTVEQKFDILVTSYTIGPINIGFKAEFDACASGGASMGLYYKCEVIQTSCPQLCSELPAEACLCQQKGWQPIPDAQISIGKTDTFPIPGLSFEVAGLVDVGFQLEASLSGSLASLELVRPLARPLQWL